MSAKTFTLLNGAAAGAAAAVPISTGTALKTMMQIATGTNAAPIRIVEWWTEFNGSAAATPITVELLGSNAAQTSLVAYVAADITPANDASVLTAGTTIQLGTALSGYNNSNDPGVTPTSVRNYATHFVPPTSGIYIQYPLGREPEQAIAKFVRHRTTAGAAVNCYVGITWEE
jgi:hypothetical protein